MDKWKDLELQKMKVGGNRKAREFFEDEEESEFDKFFGAVCDVIELTETWTNIDFRLGLNVDISSLQFQVGDTLQG